MPARAKPGRSSKKVGNREPGPGRRPDRDHRPDRGRWRRPDHFPDAGRWLWPSVLVVAALASILTFDPRLYINGDNVSYMFLARDVLQGDLWGSSKFPPLFPLLLAPVQWFVGLVRGTDPLETPRAALLAQKWLVMAFYGGSILFLARLVRRRVEGNAGPLVFLFGATLLPVVEYSHYVMSEIPFLFFQLGALDACDRLLTESGGLTEGHGPAEPASGRERVLGRGAWIRATRDRRIWLLALWLAAGFYIRTAGVAAILALGLTLVLRRRIRYAAALAGALLVFAIPWVAHSLTTPGGNPYFEQFLLVNPYYPEYGRLNAASLWQRLSANAVEYGHFHIPVSLLSIPYRSTYSPAIFQVTPPPLWAAMPVLALVILGAVRTARRKDPVTLVVLGSILLVLAWPPIWAANRFLIPLVPLLAWLLWEGLQVGKGWARRRRLGWVPGIVLALFLILNALSLDNYRIETEAYDPVWGNYFATIEWVREHTPPDAIILDRKPGFVEFLSGRRSLAFPREPDTDRMLEFLEEEGVDYVLFNHLPYEDIERYLIPAVNRRRDRFEIVAEFLDPEPDPALNGTAYVLRFLAPP